MEGLQKNTQIELPVTARKTGKHHARQLRKQELVPGVLYGSKKETTALASAERAIKKYMKAQFENQIFTVKSSDVTSVDGTTVLIKSIDVDPVTRRPINFDLYALDMNKAVRVFVELRFEGKALGLSEGGLLQPLVREIEVECLPKDIPGHISVDVTNLAVNQTIHISEITMPNGVKSVATGNLALVSVAIIEEEVIPTVVDAAAAAAAAATTTEPEVIKKGKKEEEGAEGAAGGDAKAAAKPEAKADQKK